MAVGIQGERQRGAPGGERWRRSAEEVAFGLCHAGRCRCGLCRFGREDRRALARLREGQERWGSAGHARGGDQAQILIVQESGCTSQR